MVVLITARGPFHEAARMPDLSAICLESSITIPVSYIHLGWVFKFQLNPIAVEIAEWG